MVVRTYDDELKYLERIDKNTWRIKKGFQPNMKVEGVFYVNSHLEKLMFEELRNACRPGMVGGFLPGVKQIANVAALPGIVGKSVGLPDVHSGYGFAIGNMAAFDMDDPEAVVSPGGVGFDINCGVRLLRTNLTEKEVSPVKEQLAQALFDHIPVGVGSKGIIPMQARDLDEALEMGMDWSLRYLGLAMMMTNNMENVAPQVIRSVGKQMQSLATQKMEGISVVLNDEDMTDIQAIIEGPPGTPYAGGQFRVKLVLSKDFPATPPKGFFLTKIFHPNVASPSGEICVNTLKKDWKPDLGLQHILLTVKCLLIAPNPESALNEEAGKLLLEQYDTYSSRAKLYTEIHARSSAKEERKRTEGGEGNPGPSVPQEKEKKTKVMSKEKKRTLKRL